MGGLSLKGYRPLRFVHVSSTHSSPGAEGTVSAAQSDAPADALTEPPPEPVTQPVTQRLAALQSALDRLIAATEREHERAAHREAIIDRLHDENQLLRAGEVEAMLTPIRTALYRLHDMVRRESQRCPQEPPDPAHVGPLLSAIADEIAEALARAGAERFTVRPGEAFDQVRHKPVGTVPVTDPTLDGTVVAAHTDGFGQGEQVLRRAEVVIGQAKGARAATSRAARKNASAESI